MITYRCKDYHYPTLRLSGSSWRFFLLEDVSQADGRDLAWLLALIGVVRLGVFEDASHDIAMERPFGTGVVDL